ncbi:MAG: BACON domain-containing protein [bacterium]
MMMFVRVRAFQKLAWLCGVLSMALWETAATQTAKQDSLVTFVEVDQLPRSDSVSTPVAAFDLRGNFAVVWVAHEKGLTQLLLRYFDSIGRPLTEIRPITEINDTLTVAHPHLAFTPEGLLWVVWDQTTRQQSTEVVGQILNRDFRPVNKLFTLETVAIGLTSRPRVAYDISGRMITAWVRESRPAFVVARYFNIDGSPNSDAFFIDESGDDRGIGDDLDVAVSSKGVAAMTWRGLGGGQDRIYFRSFDNPDSFIDGKRDLAVRNVAQPTLAFLSTDTLIVQWQALQDGNNVALLRAQRFDLSGNAVANPFDLTALDTTITPVVVNANEQGSFVTFWSRRDPRDRLFSEVFGQAFAGDQRPITDIAQVVRTPNNSNSSLAIESAVAPAGNYLVVFTGNDGDRNSLSPRVGAVLTQAALPDLQIAGLEISPANPKHGDPVMVKFSVLNIGPAPAAASTALVEFINANIDTSLAVPFLPANGLANFEVNMGLLAAGSYTLRVTLDYTLELPELDEQNNSAGFPFKVEEAPRLFITPDFLNFNSIFGQSNPADRILTLHNAGSDTVRWRVAVDQPWLVATPSSGIVTQSPTQNTEQVTISVNTAGLQVGDFSANLFFSSNGGNVTIPVTLTINTPLPALLLAQRRLEFAATQGGSNPPPQDFTIQNRGSGTLTWEAGGNQPWLIIAPPNGTTTLEVDQVTASINLGNLLPGQYTSKILVNSNGGNDSLEIVLNVSPKPPALQVSPTLLNFVTTEGTSNPPVQTVYIRNTGGGTLEWSVDENVIWISITPRNGQTRSRTDSIRVTASISVIGPGSYSDTFTINSNSGAQQVRVNFVVNPRPVAPDLQILTKTANLEDCYTIDYRLVTEFVLYNLGDGPAQPTLARLSNSEQIVHQANVPALQPGEIFELPFPALSLPPGHNTIRCEVEPVPGEINSNNNSVVIQEWVAGRGDANRDSLIDLRDLSHLVDLVLERLPAPPRREIWAANVVIDTVLNIADIVTLVDDLLNHSLGMSALPSQRIDFRLENSTASHTRLIWQTEQPLRGWQLRWKLSGAHKQQRLQSVRSGALEAHWKVAGDIFSVLIWTPAISPPGTDARSGELMLPLVLEPEGLLAATGLSSVGEMVVLEAKTVADGNAPPQTFLLSPAFPNPLLRAQHRVVEWRYELPEAVPVEFRIFNLLGQETRHAALGWQPAGRSQWQWDGRDQSGKLLASGVYFVEFVAGSFKTRVRLLLQ